MAAFSFYCDFHFGPNEFLAWAFSQKIGHPKKPSIFKVKIQFLFRRILVVHDEYNFFEPVK